MKLKFNSLQWALLAGVSFSAASPLIADYPSAVSALAPVAYYRLGNTNAVPGELSATNSGTLGVAFNGKYQSMSDSRGTPGAVAGDTSVSIDATAGQEIIVPNSPGYNPNGAFTVEFWANPADTANAKEAAVISMVNGQNLANANDRSGWSVQKLADQWQFVLGYDHSDGTTFYGTTLSAPAGSVVVGSWQHVVAVYSPGNVSLYINGALAATDTPAFPMLPNTLAPLLMGNRGYGGWNYVGLLDEVAIYPTALSAGEINAHYTAGIGGAPYAPLVLAQNPAVYYRLDEPSLSLPVAVNSGSWGSAADGTYQRGSTPGVPGLQTQQAHGFDADNRAVKLDGTNGYVKIPSQNSTVSEATFTAWVKRDGQEPSFSGIVFQRASAASVSTGLSFQDKGTALAYTWNDDPATYNYNPGLVLPDNSWTFVAVTVASDHAVMYVGTAAGLVAATNTVPHDVHDFSQAPIDIGWDSTSAARIMKGSVDEVAVFDKALDFNQVSGLFNAALPAILSLNQTPADPIYEGSSVTYSVGVAGSGTPTYLWRKGGSPLTGQTASTLLLSAVKPSDSGDYDVKVVLGGINLTSAPVHLNVSSSVPILTQAPQSESRFLNGTASFSVAAIGTTPITYQWKHGVDAIVGATNATLVIPDLQASDAGDYTVVVTNPIGNAQATATLTIPTPTKYAAAVVDDGPLGYWPLNEASGVTAFDYWGGRDGTIGVAVTNGVPGPAPAGFKGFNADNSAYDFGGGSVTVPALNLNKNTITITAWIKPGATEPDFAGLVFCRANGTVSGLDYNVGGQIGYHWNDSADTYNFASGLMPTPGVWNFVALVVEPDQATLYVDSGSGLQSSVNTVTHGASGFADPLKFGLDDNGGGRSFLGTIDEVAIFDYPLTPDAMTALRNAGIDGTYTGPAPVKIVQSPKGQTIMAGTAYTLSAKAAGSPPISFQWQKNGTNLPGAIRSSLAFSSAQVSDSGTYKLVATQGGANATSATALLTVNPIPDYLNATNGLVLHLKFDGDYQDATGRGNNGTPEGSPKIVAGKIGSGALEYSTDTTAGTYNYVALGALADLQFGTDTSFSVSYWIKYSGLPGDLPFLSSSANSYGNPGITFAASYKAGGWSYWLGGDAGSAGLYSPDFTINDGQWHSLVHVFDRTGDAVTYLDGAIADVRSIVGLGSFDNGASFTIGQDPTGQYQESGVEQIDDLGIWRRTLSEYEAQAIYVVGSKFGRSFDTGAPAAVVITTQFDGTNLVIGWPAGVLESAADLSGPWTAVSGATAPSYRTTPAATRQFYRVTGN